MSRFDQDTSIMRMRIETTLVELRRPELAPQSKARGILFSALLGVGSWAAIFVVIVEAQSWLNWGLVG